MKYCKLAFIILWFVTQQVFGASKLPADTGKSYKLVWADEFDKNGAPDARNWKFEKGFVRNNEAQWYQTQNAWCKNGLLIIEGEKVHIPNPVYDSVSTRWKSKRRFIEYTSASINTAGLHAWKYGRFVMRAKIDTNIGLWPAFWMLGVAGQWPSCGEIDIMEYYRGKILANVACGTDTAYKAQWFSNTKTIRSFNDRLWASKFHIWRMDWDEKEISLYVDDLLMNRVALNKLVNKDGTGINPFNQPQYMLLNMAIGGDNGGDPSLTAFPKRFEIDYVRVYQKQ